MEGSERPRVSAIYVVKNEQEFLPYSLRAIAPAVDEVVVVDNSSTDRTVEIARSFPQVKLATCPVRDFSVMRNLSISLATGDWLLLVDADEVYYPDLALFLPELLANPRADAYTAWMFHFMRGFWQTQNDFDHEPIYRRMFLFRNRPGVHFQGAVHETPRGFGHQVLDSGLMLAHYGYAKPQRDVFRRWQFYAELEGRPDIYRNLDADHVLDDRPVHRFTREHPPVIREYVAAVEPRPFAPLTGIVLTTHNDRHLVGDCLRSLQAATDGEYRLVAVDAGSTDGTIDALAELGVETLRLSADHSVSAALNAGLRHLLADERVALLAWIHPDMAFAPDWLQGLAAFVADHPSVGKVVPCNVVDAGEWVQRGWPVFTGPGPHHFEPANGFPWVMHRATVAQTGWLDEGYLGRAGYEDWDHNQVLIRAGYRVGITHSAYVYHPGLGTRSRVPRNHGEWARANHRRYREKWGTDAPPV